MAITSDIGEGALDWTAELLHLRRVGVSASVIAVTPADVGRSDQESADSLDLGDVGKREDTPALESPETIQQNADPDISSIQFDETMQSNLVDTLARYEIPLRFFQAGMQLAPALTYRRTRTVLRTTPSGGVVAHEIEEEVG